MKVLLMRHSSQEENGAIKEKLIRSLFVPYLPEFLCSLLLTVMAMHILACLNLTRSHLKSFFFSIIFLNYLISKNLDGKRIQLYWWTGPHIINLRKHWSILNSKTWLYSLVPHILLMLLCVSFGLVILKAKT